MPSRPDVPYLVDASATPVVALRAHADTDIDRCVEQCRDPLSVDWTTVPVPYSRDDAARFVRQAMPGGWESEEEWGFALDVDGRYGGTLSLRNRGGGRAEIAYGSHPDVRGTGAVERGLRLLLEWGFAERRLGTVEWWANRGNWASRRLAWRLGFDITPTPVRGYLDHRGTLVDAWLGTLLAGDDRVPRTRWLDVPRIDSPRLPIRIRPLRDADADRALEALRDPTTQHWLAAIPEDVDRAAVSEGVLSAAEEAAAGTALVVAVADAADDRLLARFDLFGVGRFGAELGYWTHPAERGRGVATEAARLLGRHALLPAEDGGLGLRRVTAHAAVDNAASRAVLTGAGFTEVGIERLGTRIRTGATDTALTDAVLMELIAVSA